MVYAPRYRDSALRYPLLLLPIFLSLFFVPQHRLPSKQTDSRSGLPKDEFKVVRMSTEHGLPHSIVYSILIDSRGFLWAATRDGLTRYDGYTFTTYWDGNAHVRVLAEDPEGNIWAGTTEELFRFDRKSGRFTAYGSDPKKHSTLTNSNVTSLLADRSGCIWIGTTNGLNRYDKGSDSFVRYLHRPDIAQHIVAMLEDGSGNLWVGINAISASSNERRLMMYVRRAGAPGFERIRLPEELSRRYHQSHRLFVDPNGFICHMAGSAAVERKIMLLRIDPVTGLVVDTVSSIERLAAKEGLLGSSDTSTTSWFAELASPLVKPVFGNTGLLLAELTYSPDNRRLLSLAINYPPVFPPRLQGLLQDRGGLYWACSDDGLFKIARSAYFFPPPIRISTPPHADHTLSRIRSIYRDSHGDLWVGTDHQLLQYHTGSDIVTDHTAVIGGPGQLRNRTANVMYEVPPYLYAGTNSGLYRYDRAAGRFSVPYPSADRRRVRCMTQDRKGNLWVGSIEEIQVFAPDKSIIYRESLGPKQRHFKGAIWELLCDSKGKMWGGAEAGLYRWDSGFNRPRYYQHSPDDPHSLPKGAVWAIHEDRKGNIWVGVYGGGLARYRPESDDFVSISKENGLPSNGICAILEDALGNLWISTSNGLTCYTAPDSTAGINTSGRILTYTTSDGLIGREFALKAAWRDTDGVLYFGGVNQITRFNPASLRKNSHIPPLVVTSFRANDSLISLELLDGDSVILPYRKNHLVVEFAALDYLNPEGNLYAYKLEGVDKDWTYSGNRRYASYSGVDPGDYVLHIRGANSHGVWNPEGMRIHIRITPPLWGTFWFRLLAMGSILSAGFVSYRAWQRRRRERSERRVIEARLQALRLQMKPHFIFNSLNSIHSFILLHKSDEASKYLTKFARLMRIALYHSGHSSISLHDELQFLQLYAELEGLRFDSSFTYDISVAPDIPVDTVRLPSMLIQPYVENAIHHGLRNKTRGKLLVRFEMKDDHMICTIEDNGIGRKAAGRREHRIEGHHSMGTSVTQQRLELLNSIHQKEFRVKIIDCYDENGSAVGTRVVLRIPFQDQI